LKGELGKRKDIKKAVKYIREGALSADRDVPEALYVCPLNLYWQFGD
jgi:hypothetical protein